MELKEVIKSRHSCRTFLPTTISNEIIKEIVESARLAPSSKNLQQWKFICIKTEKQSTDIAKLLQEYYIKNKDNPEKLKGNNMKTEIECRLLKCNIEEFINKLKDNNATFVGDWLQIRNVYDFNPVKPNSWIRLRTNGKETTLTIKEISNNKIDGTKECEIIVSDFDTTDELLNKLGYFARSTQQNRRIRYILDNVEIDIDFWPLIPTYVEFEAEKQEDIEKLCKKLDIDFNSLVTLDVQSIYSHYGIDINNFNKLILEENRK